MESDYQVKCDGKRPCSRFVDSHHRLDICTISDTSIDAGVWEKNASSSRCPKIRLPSMHRIDSP